MESIEQEVTVVAIAIGRVGENLDRFHVRLFGQENEVIMFEQAEAGEQEPLQPTGMIVDGQQFMMINAAEPLTVQEVLKQIALLTSNEWGEPVE